MDFGCVLKVEVIEFVGSLDMKFQRLLRYERVKGDSQIFGLGNRKDGIFVYEDWLGSQRSRFWGDGDIRSLVLDTLSLKIYQIFKKKYYIGRQI